MRSILEDYSIEGTIFQSASTIVYRARRISDGRPVALEIPNEARLPTQTFAHYQREFEALERLAGPGIIRAFQLLQEPGTCCLVLEDFAARSLADLVYQRQLSVDQVLRLAPRLAEILERVHHGGVIHKDINPSNILFNPDTDELKLIDFGACWLASRQAPSIRPLHLLEGTVAYMSPEQTGRINRPLDYRTDFYALGVTLYELLSGRLPFETIDVQKLVHSHIALEPPPLDGGIPEPLADIVMKLMAKAADERYRSAWGLQHDLRACAELYPRDPTLAGIRIGQRDISDRLQVPERLYGRERERRRLLDGFEQVSKGERAFVMVTGAPGVGKSALVTELYKPVTQRHGHFVVGKFEQYRQGVPYSAIASALGELVEQILVEPDDVLQAWRHELLAALGTNGRVLTDIVPQLELLLGEQPPVPRLESAGAQNRLQHVFLRFLSVVCTAEHPLVLFLDDLQWADAASLAWFHSILTHRDTNYLFAIGSYRDNEVDESHPLTLALREIRAHGVSVDTITLAPLRAGDVGEFLADALHCDISYCQELADLLISKTHGNPFFINGFLHLLYREHHLFFEIKHRRWAWSLAEITALDSTDNVVDLMLHHLQTLPSATQRALTLSACIGTRFDTHTLSAICAEPASDVHQHLLPAIELGLLEPIANVRDDCDDPSMFAGYRFLHDRVQQAAYALIDEQSRVSAHLQIARLLQDSAPDEQPDAGIFAIVDHFNRGASGLDSPAERVAVAGLNLLAGRRAIASMAYQTAVDLLRIGIDLIPEPSWQAHYELARDLMLAAIEAEYLNNNRASADELSRELLLNARTTFDRINVYQFQILFHIACDRMNEAIELALDILPMVGISLPRQVEERARYEQVLVDKLLVGNVALRSVDEVGILIDPERTTALRVLCRASSAAIIANPEVLQSMVLTAIDQCLRHGHSELSAMIYAWQAVLSCGIVGDIERGYEFGQFALELLERFPAPGISTQTLVTLYAFVMHWKRPLEEILQSFPTIVHKGLENGEIEYACYAAIDYLSTLVFAGRPLSYIRTELAHYFDVIQRCDMAFQLDNVRVWMVAVAALMDGDSAPEEPIRWSLDGGDPARLSPENSSPQLRGLIYGTRMMIAYYLDHWQEALEYGRRLQGYLHLSPGTLNIAQYNTFYSLTLLACHTTADPADRQALLDHVVANQDQLRSWAEHAPSNFGHRFALIEAERAHVAGDTLRAMELFDDAIAKANDNASL